MPKKAPEFHRAPSVAPGVVGNYAYPGSITYSPEEGLSMPRSTTSCQAQEPMAPIV